MQPLNRRHALIFAAVACATGIGPASASAQGLPGALPGVAAPGLSRSDDAPSSGAPKGPAQPPAAVPGAKARAPAAPATRSVNDMNPTEALFDAIDRGDIASARDALNRGADLNGVNVLGMTPMELSVDLGRNDISFLLLSMRADDSGSSSRGPTTTSRPSAPTKSAPVVAKAAAPGRRTAAKSASAPTKVATEKPVGLPKLWSNDGGSPQPNAGFLGFGSRQASN
ncbi:MAG TPA: ankyrin repeat domain-containing protein [Rhodopila sp.]|nr:ankyrin repeat domain-containing protein [Rhodopila sp.]